MGARLTVSPAFAVIVVVSSHTHFRFEDVPAGRYLLTVTARELDPTRRDLGPESNFKREVVVPQMPDGRSDEPLDVGTIEIGPR